jgi:predicted Zn-dependent peptidase
MPSIGQIGNIPLLPVQQFTLDNGVNVQLLEAGSQEVTKIDILFPAGLVQAGKPLIASTVNNLLSEGTATLSSEQIAETFDFYGAYLGQQHNYHYSLVSLLTLTRYLPDTLPVLEEIIKNPIFPESEINIYLNKKRQEFIVDSEKVKTLASRKFNNVIFGEDHPYGIIPTLELFDQIERKDLVAFHKNHYNTANCKIIVAGQPGKDWLNQLNKYLGTEKIRNSKQPESLLPQIQPSTQHEHHIPHTGALQSAIKIGKPLFNRLHPDFLGITILNTILGGYFGSRLMKSIREEKGYTYGISSYVIPLKHHGFWTISTEVKAEVRNEAIKAILHEMNLLRSQQVTSEELELVKNYMLGELIRNFDGPFSTSENIRSLIENDLDLTYYNRFVETIHSITPQQIHELALKHLNPDDFYIISAG